MIILQIIKRRLLQLLTVRNTRFNSLFRTEEEPKPLSHKCCGRFEGRPGKMWTLGGGSISQQVHVGAVGSVRVGLRHLRRRDYAPGQLEYLWPTEVRLVIGAT